jgi:hypothetical protein
VREITGGALPRLSDVKLIPDHSEDAPVGDVTAGSYALDQLPSLNVTRNGVAGSMLKN